MLKTIESLITTKGSQVCQEYCNTDYSCISMKTLVILIFLLHYYNYQVIQRKVGKSYSQVLQYVYHFLRRRIKEGTITFSQKKKKKKEGIITLNKNKGKVDQFLKGIGLGYIFTKKIYGKRKNQLVFFFMIFYICHKSDIKIFLKWSLHKYKCLWGVGGKGWGSNLQEGASHTYTLRLG